MGPFRSRARRFPSLVAFAQRLGERHRASHPDEFQAISAAEPGVAGGNCAGIWSAQAASNFELAFHLGDFP
jgi:hypothetical protein